MSFLCTQRVDLWKVEVFLILEFESTTLMNLTGCALIIVFLNGGNGDAFTLCTSVLLG